MLLLSASLDWFWFCFPSLQRSRNSRCCANDHHSSAGVHFLIGNAMCINSTVALQLIYKKKSKFFKMQHYRKHTKIWQVTNYFVLFCISLCWSKSLFSSPDLLPCFVPQGLCTNRICSHFMFSEHCDAHLACLARTERWLSPVWLCPCWTEGGGFGSCSRCLTSHVCSSLFTSSSLSFFFKQNKDIKGGHGQVILQTCLHSECFADVRLYLLRRSEKRGVSRA